jgi:hypothetical protein
VVLNRLPLRIYRIEDRLIQFWGRFFTSQLDLSTAAIWLTPRNTALLEKQIFAQIVKKLSAFYGPRLLISRFVRTCNRSQFRSRLHASILHALLISPWVILLLPLTLRSKMFSLALLPHTSSFMFSPWGKGPSFTPLHNNWWRSIYCRQCTFLDRTKEDNRLWTEWK